HRGLLRAIGIELGDERAPLIGRGDFVDGGRHRLARPTPVGVEVDQHRDLGVLDGAGERLLIERELPVEQHRLPALAALGAVRSPRGVDAVPRFAELTAQREMLHCRLALRSGPTPTIRHVVPPSALAYIGPTYR